MQDQPGRDQLTAVEQLDAVKTWRYLRLAMIVLVVGLGVSIGFEWSKTPPPHCFQDSISAYYYTPVRGYFVGALVAIGVCLVSLKGSTPAEDVLLNLAGAFAPVVALVPTPGTGSCASILGNRAGRDANIANNMFALLVVGALSLVLVAVLVRRSRPDGATAPAPLGWGAAFLVWLVATLVFAFDRDLFVRTAHYTAAILMFGCIVLVVRSNARSAGSALGSRAARGPDASVAWWYNAVATAMLGSVVVFGAAALLGWPYWVLGVETALIVLFAIFWVIQTKELWHQGLR